MKKQLKDITLGELINTCSKCCTFVCEDIKKCPFKNLNICFLRWKNFKDLLDKEVDI